MILAKQFRPLFGRRRVLSEFIEAILSGCHYRKCQSCKLLPNMLPRMKSPPFRAGLCGTKSLKLLAPRAGFEPATNRLTAGCSTTELPGNMPALRHGAYNKAKLLCKA